MLRRKIAPGAALLVWLALWAVTVLLPSAAAFAQEDEEEDPFPYARRGFYVGFGALVAVDTFEDEYRKAKYHTNDPDDDNNILSTDREGGSRIEDPRTRQRLPDSDCRAAGPEHLRDRLVNSGGGQRPELPSGDEPQRGHHREPLELELLLDHAHC